MRKALITGTSRGIGKAIKELFVERGIDVLSPARSELNLSSPESIREYVKKVDGIDILVNCAGINDLASIDEMTEEKLNEMIQVNLLAQTMLIKYLSPYMKSQKNADFGTPITFQ